MTRRSLAVAFIPAMAWCYAGGPAYSRAKADRHRQIYSMSCIPMSVELVLKLTDRVPLDYFELQEAWKNKSDGSFADFDNRTIAGVTFRRQFATARGRNFPIKELFAAIDSELEQGRYVIVGLKSGRDSYHNWVIVERTRAGDYRTVTKYGDKTVEITNTKARIKRMKGTDIGTYTSAP